MLLPLWLNLQQVLANTCTDQLSIGDTQAVMVVYTDGIQDELSLVNNESGTLTFNVLGFDSIQAFDSLVSSTIPLSTAVDTMFVYDEESCNLTASCSFHDNVNISESTIESTVFFRNMHFTLIAYNFNLVLSEGK